LNIKAILFEYNGLFFGESPSMIWILGLDDVLRAVE